jgi:TonB family protein
MAETTETTSVNTDAGHLAMRLEGIHAPELSFSFEHPQSRVGVGASIATHILFFAIAIFIATYGPTPSATAPPERDRLPTDIVWLQEPGPGGGGGGGGNQMPEPPKKAEVPGKQAISVPVTRPETPKPEPKPEEPPDPLLNIPAKTLGDTAQLNPGLLDAAMAASMISQGTGTGGGGGTGRGTGIGSGDGSGLGAGSGGGTGGGVYRPGNGVELPRVIQEIRPQYTADAMRAKVQGTVWVECVVLPDGTVGEANVTKSLDSVFGLDQEALKAAKRWRFIPGRRLGQPVPVLVTIELTFTLR